MNALLIEKFDGDVTVSTDPRAPAGSVRLEVGPRTVHLSRSDAATLRQRLGDVLTDEREFVHTIGRHRADGAYVVERRSAASSGHRKVFDSFAACAARFEELPRRFAASDLEGAGVSGSRRHLLVRHFAEHPAFPCELVAKQPLTARKVDRDGAGRRSRVDPER